MLLHHADHLNQLAVVNAVTRGDLHALMIAALPDAPEHELLGDLRGEFRAVIAGDEVEHQVDGCGAARAGDASRVDLEDLLARFDGRILLRECRQRLPMQSRALAREQPRLGKNETPRIDAAERRASAIQLAQPLPMPRVYAANGSNPETTMSVRASAASSMERSALSEMPLLATTGPPSTETMCQRYNSPLKRFATRSGSMADMKPIDENCGSSRKWKS